MKRLRRHPSDLRLKIAILESRRTQRWLAVETRIGESRLSEIVGHRGAPATLIEQERIVKHLNRARVTCELPDLSIEDLWAAEEIYPAPPAITDAAEKTA